jgi:hypothetical protein
VKEEAGGALLGAREPGAGRGAGEAGRGAGLTLAPSINYRGMRRGEVGGGGGDDGSVRHADRSVRHADGSVRHADLLTRHADGSWIKAFAAPRNTENTCASELL